jgi:hypothetical protein
LQGCFLKLGESKLEFLVFPQAKAELEDGAGGAHASRFRMR